MPEILVVAIVHRKPFQRPLNPFQKVPCNKNLFSLVNHQGHSWCLIIMNQIIGLSFLDFLVNLSLDSLEAKV